MTARKTVAELQEEMDNAQKRDREANHCVSEQIVLCVILIVSSGTGVHCQTTV